MSLRTVTGKRKSAPVHRPRTTRGDRVTAIASCEFNWTGVPRMSARGDASYRLRARDAARCWR